jgi:hypothetical protein
VINVSTFSLKVSKASPAFPILLCPSNENGLVTTHTVKIPSSFEISAITGAAQEPVPPHNPQVINTISAPSNVALNSSLDSSAAFLPISGSLPAQSPLVVAFQIVIFLGAFEVYNACESVLTAMKSTHSKPVSIILLTALLPPQPTHKTFIFAIGEINQFIFNSSGQLIPFQARISFNLSCDAIIFFIIY